MSQARRKRGRSSSRQKGASSHGFGMFAAGLVVGAVAASFFMGLSSDDPESIGRGIEHMISASKNRFAEEAAAPPSAPEKKASTEFDFYMLLPEIERVVPKDQPAGQPVDVAASAEVPAVENTAAEPVQAASPPAAPAVVEPTSSGNAPRYELQAGAFVHMADADRLKAELALKGLSARIQKVSIQGRGDFFRVRLGPYANTTELEAADRQLAGLGIDALRLKVSGG